MPAIAAKVLRDPLPRPRKLCKDIPEGVEKVLFKALSKKPEDRYKDMGLFAETLETLAAAKKSINSLSWWKKGIIYKGPEEIHAPTIDTESKGIISEEEPSKSEELISEPVKSATTKKSKTSYLKWPGIIGGSIIVIIILGFIIGRNDNPVFFQVIPTLTNTPQPTITASPVPTFTMTPRATNTPKPTFTPVPVSAILFFDDFQDGKANKWDATVGTWVVKKNESGQFVYQGSGPNNYPQTWPVQHATQKWTDYAFESKIRIINGGVFILVRANGSNFYNVFLNSNDTNIALAKWINGQYTVVKNINHSISVNKWYLVRIEIVGQTYNLFIDDNLITTYKYESDSPVVSGTIGYYIGGGNIVQFDDVRVWTLNAK